MNEAVFMTDEEIEYDFLKDSDAKYVYSVYPESKSKDWCPSCDGRDESCNHKLQRQLFKHYANAGIGLTYQRIGWDDYEGPENIKEFSIKYAKNWKAYKENNIGMMLLGGFGTGKTTAVSILLKDLVRARASCFFTTYVNLIEMLGGSFYDASAKRLYKEKIERSNFLVIDDIGKELSNRLTETTLDNVLRQRVQTSRPTFITSNLSIESIKNEYKRSAFSLIVESSKSFKFDGNDARANVRRSRLENAELGIIKPIV